MDFKTKLKCFLWGVVTTVILVGGTSISLYGIIVFFVWALEPENVRMAVTILGTILSLFVLGGFTWFFYLMAINDVLDKEDEKSSVTVLEDSSKGDDMRNKL